MGLGAAGTAAAIGATGAIGSSLINGSNQPSGQTTVQSGPWSGEVPFINRGMNAAASLYSKNPNGPAYYPGQTYASLNSGENSSLNAIYGTGMNGTAALNAANSGLASVAGQSSDPSSNPYLQAAEGNTIAATLPSIEGQFGAGGRADSGDAAYGAASGLGTALGNLNYGEVNTLNQQKINAAMMAPGINNAVLSGQEAAFGSGQAQQQNSQNQINANVNRYNYGQMQPYNALQLYESEIGNSGATGGTTSTPYYTNGFANAMSGATGAMGLYNGFQNMFGSNTTNVGSSTMSPQQIYAYQQLSQPSSMSSY